MAVCMEIPKQAQIVIPPGPRLGDLVIEAVGLQKGYGDRQLIDGIDFKLPPGGIVGVIGPNINQTITVIIYTVLADLIGPWMPRTVTVVAVAIEFAVAVAIVVEARCLLVDKTVAVLIDTVTCVVIGSRVNVVV